MIDRIRLAVKVLFVRHIVVVTKNEQFSTMEDSTQVSYQDGGYVKWGNNHEK